MNKRVLISVGSVLAVVGLVTVGYLRFTRVEESAPWAKDGGRSSGASSYLSDFNNPRILLGYSQNVFAAKIYQEISAVPRSVPHVQYDAEVIYNIKGNLGGRIVVDVSLADGSRLVEGAVYLFAARHLDTLGPWYYVGSHSASKSMVTEISGVTNAEMLDRVLKHPRTYELLDAYPNEILFSSDIQNGWIFNSFGSLSDEQKQVVYDKFNELIPPRPIPDELPPPPSPPSQPPTEASWSDCKDSKDNDADGLTDKADPDCVPYSHENVGALCADNDDNDGDGLKDAEDPDCVKYYPQPAPPPQPPPPPAPTST